MLRALLPALSVLALASCGRGPQRAAVLAGELPADTAASLEWRAPWVPPLLGLPEDERVRGFEGADLRVVRLVGAEAQPVGFERDSQFRALNSRGWFERSVQSLTSGDRAQVELHADLTRTLVPMLERLLLPGEQRRARAILAPFLGLESLLSAAGALRLEREGRRVEGLELELCVQLARAPTGLVKALLLPPGATRLESAASTLPERYDYLWARVDVQRILSQEQRALARQAGVFGTALRQLMQFGQERVPFLRDDVLAALGQEYLCFWPRGGQPLDVAQSQLVVAVNDAAALLEAAAGLEFSGWEPFAQKGGGRHEARLRWQGRSVGVVLETAEQACLRIGAVAAVRKPLPKAEATRRVLAKPGAALALFDVQPPAFGAVLGDLPDALTPLTTGRLRWGGAVVQEGERLRVVLETRR